MSKYPHEFSGGQRQRICIARAIILKPSVLIADEAVSALDVSIQMQILNLLLDLRATIGLSILFISHDIDVVEYLCDRIAVMYGGRIVEENLPTLLLDNPRHPYTARLRSARPRLGLERRSAVHHNAIAVTSHNAAESTGCTYVAVCDRASEYCVATEPALVHIGDAALACFHPLDEKA